MTRVEADEILSKGRRYQRGTGGIRHGLDIVAPDDSKIYGVRIPGMNDNRRRDQR